MLIRVTSTSWSASTDDFTRNPDWQEHAPNWQMIRDEDDDFDEDFLDDEDDDDDFLDDDEDDDYFDDDEDDDDFFDDDEDEEFFDDEED